MATLADVRGDISRRLVLNGSGKDAEIDDCIRQAIRMNQRKRYWFLRTIGNVIITAGAESISVPSDFASIESVDLLYNGTRYTRGTGFMLLEYDEFKRLYLTGTAVTSGTPSACSLFNRTLYLNHAPAAQMTAQFTYFKKDAALPMSGDVISVMFDDGYDLIRATAQYLMNSSVLENTDASTAEMMAMQTALDEQHVFYERARR